MGKFDFGGEIFVLERGKKLPILLGDDAVFRRLLYKEKKTCTILNAHGDAENCTVLVLFQ
jgi:hypothetical protein